MNKKFRVGDVIVVNGRTERVTAVSETAVSCGLTISVPYEDIKVPCLSDGFFERNGFEVGEADGCKTFLLTGDNAIVCAIKHEKFYDITIKNKVYVFNGPIDSFNEFLHALDVCAISTEFACE